MIIENESQREWVLIGKESVGKTQLLASLTGRLGESANFRGTTVAVQAFDSPLGRFIDTPGILLASDALTTKEALKALDGHARVILVVKATHLDQDLSDLLPLAQGKQALVLATFWDRLSAQAGAQEALDRIQKELGVPVIALDARHLAARRPALEKALDAAAPLKVIRLQAQAGWHLDAESRFGALPVIAPWRPWPASSCPAGSASNTPMPGRMAATTK